MYSVMQGYCELKQEERTKLEADMAAYLAKGGSIESLDHGASSLPAKGLTLRERVRRTYAKRMGEAE